MRLSFSYKILGIFLLLIIGTAKLRADFNGEIYSEGSQVDTVDFGMCQLGDSLHNSFIVRNTGTEKIRISKIDPSFYLGKVNDPDHSIDFEEFAMYNVSLPYDLKPDSSIRITITYKAKGGIDTNQYSVGRKLALLKLGIHDPSITQPSQEQLVVSQKYILIARKTKHSIDGMDNPLYFDSVYVNPASKSNRILRIQNVSNLDLNIDNYQLKVLSPLVTPAEFEVGSYSLPIPITRKSSQNISLSYSPKDMGPDSAILLLTYHPYPTQYPDSIDVTGLLTKAIGVVQNLSVLNAEVNHTNDTIDMGRVWIGREVKAKCALINSGNINFGITSTNLWEEFIDSDAVGFKLLRDISKVKNLAIGSTDTIQLSFLPDRRGELSARYIVGSNIATRAIKNLSASALNKVITVIGEGIEPYPTIEKDSVEFGNVVLYPDCPPSKTFSLPINNTGNADLIIYQANVKPPFSTSSIDTMRITPYSRKYLDIIFSARDRDDYKEVLTLVTNANPPNNIIKIFLRASVVSPVQVDLLMPKEIKAKPGRLVTIPVLVDTGRDVKNIVIARTFKDRITYNGTILRFSGYENTGTASEGARQIVLTETTDKNSLDISIEMQPEAYFLPREVLIYLKFNTYLGNSDSTALAFANPSFGDGNCSKVLLNLNPGNGIFKIDSVCGIEYKILNQSDLLYIKSITPFPADKDFIVEYELQDKADTELRLYDINGIAFLSINGLPGEKGSNKICIPCSDLSPGMYLCEIRAGADVKRKNIIIVR